MDELARVFFQMDAADAHAALTVVERPALPEGHWDGVSIVEGYGKGAAAGQRGLVLGNLKALGQIGIEVVLAGEQAVLGNGGAQGQGDAQGQIDGVLIDDGQRTGHAHAHLAHGAVGLGLRRIDRRAGAKHLGARQQLDVDLKADNGFEGHGGGRRAR